MRAPVQLIFAGCGGLCGALGAAGVVQVSGLRWALVVFWSLLLGFGCISAALTLGLVHLLR